MAARTTKVAVSVPTETFVEVEKWCQELCLPRSAAFVQGMRLWLRQRQEEELEERYVKGYRRHPEQAREIEPFFRAGLASFTREKW